MTVRIAINGFGRIGRNVCRALFESGRTDIELVAINDLAPLATNRHLLKYDSVHGAFNFPVETVDELVPSSQMQSSHSTDCFRDLPSLSAAHCVQLCSQPTRVLQNHDRTMDKRAAVC